MDVKIEESDLLRLIQGFLETRGYHAACRAIELQLDDKDIPQDDRTHMQFLRNLVLDGRWDDVLNFVEPLERSKPEEHATLRYALLKQWYFELLVDWSDVECGDGAAGPVVVAEGDTLQLSQLEKCVVALQSSAPTPAAFTRLCDVAAAADLMEQPELRGWSLQTARVRIASDAIAAVGSVLFGLGSAADPEDGGRSSPTIYDGDRLVELVGKGLCFNGPETLTVQLANVDGTCPSPVRMAGAGARGSDGGTSTDGDGGNSDGDGDGDGAYC